jgi:hypothetical protein
MRSLQQNHRRTMCNFHIRRLCELVTQCVLNSLRRSAQPTGIYYHNSIRQRILFTTDYITDDLSSDLIVKYYSDYY